MSSFCSKATRGEPASCGEELFHLPALLGNYMASQGTAHASLDLKQEIQIQRQGNSLSRPQHLVQEH
jgi:hypothetical protein